MTGIIGFHALAFDLVDGRLVAGQLVDCGSPALAIQTAQGRWKLFGHVGAVAFSRTSSFDRENQVTSMCSAGSGRFPTSIWRKPPARSCVFG
jgi:hypothetical protein